MIHAVFPSLSAEERMIQFDRLMLAHGYRPPVREDLVPGVELLMVEVEQFMEPHNQPMNPSITGTRIKLDDKPIAPSNFDSKREVVFYHCVTPGWDGQCFVPLLDFIASGYHKGMYANNTRFVVNTRK